MYPQIAYLSNIMIFSILDSPLAMHEYFLALPLFILIYQQLLQYDGVYISIPYAVLKVTGTCYVV